MDQGRAALPELQAKLPASARLFDVVIDEWALSREELPPEPRPAGAEIWRTEKGVLSLPTNTNAAAPGSNRMLPRCFCCLR